MIERLDEAAIRFVLFSSETDSLTKQVGQELGMYTVCVLSSL